MTQYARKVKSVDECFNIATNQNYAFFSLQYGGECWLSDNLTRATIYGQCGSNCGTHGCGNVNCTCSAMQCASGEDCGSRLGNVLYQIVNINSTNIHNYPSTSVKPSLSPTLANSNTKSHNYTYLGMYDYTNLT